MKFIKKFILYIKNILKKQEIKKLEEPKVILNKSEREDFINSLHTNTIKKEKNKKIETLICNGDGLGIQGKITS